MKASMAEFYKTLARMYETTSWDCLLPFAGKAGVAESVVSELHPNKLLCWDKDPEKEKLLKDILAEDDIS